MFERFTEPARRSLFFARYEASVLGRLTIETEHLLLGILKQPEPVLSHLLDKANVAAGEIKQLIYARTAVPTSHVDSSVEIPFGKDARHVLSCTADEASRLLHSHIGTEHLLLGLLSIERGLAWDVLREKRFSLGQVREALVTHVSATSPPPPEIAGMIAAMSPLGVQRSRPQRAIVYDMTVRDCPSPGRRATAKNGASFSTLDFRTSAQDGAEAGVRSIGPLSMWATTLPQLALVLEEFLGAPVLVLDHSDLNQRFDIELQGTYDNPEALIAAVRDQLGLELTRSL